MDEYSKKELEDYFCRFTFGQFVTLILLEIVTLFFVFYLGAHYGPDLIGGREQKKTAVSLPPAGPSKVDEIVGAPSVDYTYPEILTDTGRGKAIRVKPSGVTVEEYEKRKGRPAASEGEREKAPPPIQEVKVKEAIKGPDTPKGKYTIQVGSFQSAEEASSVAAGWKEKGYGAFMSVGEIPQKGTWHRVRIGGFPSREKAEEFLEKFRTKEKMTGLVVLSGS